MSAIAIKDLTADTTLDHIAMSKLHGGKARHCPKDAPGGYSPNADDRRREHKSFDLVQMGTGVASQIDDLLDIGPMCGPMDVVR